MARLQKSCLYWLESEHGNLRWQAVWTMEQPLHPPPPHGHSIHFKASFSNVRTFKWQRTQLPVYVSTFKFTSAKVSVIRRERSATSPTYVRGVQSKQKLQALTNKLVSTPTSCFDRGHRATMVFFQEVFALKFYTRWLRITASNGAITKPQELQSG
jgi:hypothetical protein